MPIEHKKSWSIFSIGGDLQIARKILCTLAGILLAYAIVLFGTMIRNNIRQYRFIGKADALRQITVEADGKVTAVPDVGVVSLGFSGSASSAGEAQEKNTKVMNALVERLAALGVDKKDIQTSSYSVSPRYKYRDGEGPIADGFDVNQSVTVKIHDLAKAGKILALVGDAGANSVSGLDFTIDDPEMYRAKARDLALARAREKIVQLARGLGVRFTGIVAYYESQGGGVPLYGLGGPTYMEKAISVAVPPTIEPGGNDIVVHVSVTYEIE